MGSHIGIYVLWSYRFILCSVLACPKTYVENADKIILFARWLIYVLEMLMNSCKICFAKYYRISYMYNLISISFYCKRWHIFSLWIQMRKENWFWNKKLEMLTNEKHSKEKLKFERGFANYIGSHYYADWTLCFLSCNILESCCNKLSKQFHATILNVLLQTRHWPIIAVLP